MAYIGEVRIFGGNYPPAGWRLCDGQLLAKASYTALFSILGTRFGGDGVTNFALPDFRGRAPLGPGQGPGLSPRQIGQSGGVESVALSEAQLPSHTHALRALAGNGTSAAAANQVPARSAAAIPHYGATADASLAAGAIAAAGSGEAHNNMQPYLTVTYIICIEGVFPPHP